MSDNVRDIVDLALDDKPNKAGDILNDVLVDKLGDKVQDIKNQVSNELFGQEHDPDAEQVEVPSCRRGNQAPQGAYRSRHSQIVPYLRTEVQMQRT